MNVLEAPGMGRRIVVSLEREEQERDEYLAVLRSARTQNGIFLRRAIQSRNRACLNAIHPDAFSGPGYAQKSCHGSFAQVELQGVAARVVDHYESAVEYQDDPDPERKTWVLREYLPRGKDMINFRRAAHGQYALVDFNRDEREFAHALDAVGTGVWARNTPAANAFSIPLPAKVDDSSRFFPDFLWWVGDVCWALDTTGAHLLEPKVRGKLIALTHPRVALVVRGRVDLATNSKTTEEAWSLVRARSDLPPSSEVFDDLQSLLASLLARS